MTHPLSILPLGGLGKIGMNAMLVGAEDRLVLVDCGVGFAGQAVLGAEKMLPDLGLIASLRDRIEAVLITHGHEDHIGALPWVVPALDPHTPIFASPFTTALIRHRMEEHGVWEAGRMRRFVAGETFDVGPFEVSALRVTHSLPDCASLVLRSEVGTILHTGDWKIDAEPMDGEHFDFAGFERAAKDGIDVMLSDSTNILAAGRTQSEAGVVRALSRHIEAWKGRVIVTMFASNLHRLRGLGQLAKATGRRLVLAGRSYQKYLEAAETAGIGPLERGIVIDIEEARNLAPHEALVVTTGSQGEPRAALGRAAEGQHDELVLGSDDIVLHSARIIPGNEGDVYAMWNNLAHRGVTLVNERAIHASGHAQRDELVELLSIVRPKVFVPVHGETTFLKAHAALGRELGVTSIAIENGERLGFRVDRVDDVERTQVDLVPIWNDGPATGDEDAMKLRERKRIAWNGLIVVDAHVRRADDGHASLVAVNVDTRALFLGDDDMLLDELRRVAGRVVGACPPGTPWSEIGEAMKASLRAAAKKLTDKRPDVIVVLHEGRIQ